MFWSDWSYRFCTYCRSLNAMTKSDCHPLPGIDYCVDCVGSTNFVTKIDFLMGYWQVPLIANIDCEFVTPDTLSL